MPRRADQVGAMVMLSAQQPVRFGHVPQLDGIRALAISIVFFAHVGLERLVPGGFGVTIFFFLSGYLITSLLREEFGQKGSIDLKAFYLRRILRINPPMWITLLIALSLVTFGVIDAHPRPLQIFAQFIFVSNYAEIIWAGDGLPGLPLWSLAVEEHYYLIFPFLYAAAASRLSGSSIAALCALGCLAALAIRVVHVIYGDMASVYYLTHTRIDSILFGSCLAVWNNPRMDPYAWRPSMAALGCALAALLACLLVRNEMFRETIRYTIQGVSLFVVFSYVIQSEGIMPSLLKSEPAKLIGLLSYSLYLGHLLIITVIERYLPDIGVVHLIALALPLSLIYAGGMYYLVERPAGRLRRTLHNRALMRSQTKSLEN